MDNPKKIIEECSKRPARDLWEVTRGGFSEIKILYCLIALQLKAEQMTGDKQSDLFNLMVMASRMEQGRTTTLLN